MWVYKLTNVETCKAYMGQARKKLLRQRLGAHDARLILKRAFIFGNCGHERVIGRDEAEAASGDLNVRMGLIYARQGESGERRGARERSGSCDAPRGCPSRTDSRQCTAKRRE